MAEIPIQQKTGSKNWIWLIALLAIAAIAWMLFANNNEPEPAVGPVGAAGAVPVLVAAIAPAAEPSWGTRTQA